MGNFIDRLKNKNFNILDHLDELNLGYKDKVVVLLGETGVGKSTFINEITGKKDKRKESSKSVSCTRSIEYTNYFYDGYNYYFVDTPGLNDASGDITNIGEIQKLKKGIISAVILVRNYTVCRLTESYKNALIQFMTILPSQNFFEHVIVLETFYSKENELDKESLLDAISKDKDLLLFINDNNIETPNNIHTFQVNLKSKANDKNQIFIDILNIIKNMHPLYKTYKEEDIFFIREVKEDNENYIYYSFIKKISSTDFNDKSTIKEETIENGRYLAADIAPSLIIVRRDKTKTIRQPFWLWRWLPCFEDEYLVNYYLRKKYEINNKIYTLNDYYTHTWESDDEKGEKFRKQLESELSSNTLRKLLPKRQ